MSEMRHTAQPGILIRFELISVLNSAGTKCATTAISSDEVGSELSTPVLE